MYTVEKLYVLKWNVLVDIASAFNFDILKYIHGFVL